MEVDWESDRTFTLANPRLPETASRPEGGFSNHVWIATSGTTGAIKWAALSKEALLLSAQTVNTHFQIDSKDIWLNPLPSFHVGGLGIWARAYLSGSKVHVLEKWHPEVFCKMAEAKQATRTSLVPTQLYDILCAGLQAPPSLSTVIVGGGALDERLFFKALELGWPIALSYGMTECASQIATSHPKDPRMQILSHVEIKDSPAKIKSRALLTAYWQEGDCWDPKREGWFHTEDLISLEGNFLQFQGRLGDWIKISGENVNFALLQRKCEFLLKQQGIDGCLVAASDPRLQHRLILHFVQDFDRAQLVKDLFNFEVMPYERIASIKQVSSISRSPLGKIIKS